MNANSFLAFLCAAELPDAATGSVTAELRSLNSASVEPAPDKPSVAQGSTKVEGVDAAIADKIQR